MANAICKEIQATCKFKGEAFDALIPNLKAKRFDASISAIDITDARAKQVLFSDAYYDSTASYVTLKGKATLESAKKCWRSKWNHIPTIHSSRNQTIYN